MSSADRPDSILQQLRRVETLICDVDGVLTDGGLYYAADGNVSVRFHVHDGMGLALARRAGLRVGLISGRKSEQVARRAAELGIDEVHLGAKDKKSVIESIMARLDLERESVGFVGDDLIDLPAMHVVGVPIAVANAVEAVRNAALVTTERAGGHGAVREIIDLILGDRLHAIDPFAPQ